MNCPACAKRTGRRHCESSPTCDWHICLGCKIVFDLKGRSMVWGAE